MTPYFQVENDESVLVHYGVKGMKWGVRRTAQQLGNAVSKKLKERSDRKAATKATKKSYAKDKGPRRFKVLNAANSAARTYYRRDRTHSFNTYRKQGAKLERKMARLTENQVKAGRYRVARARFIKRQTLSTIAGGAAGLGLIASGAGVIGIPAAAAVGAASHFASGANYYWREKRAYGNLRAKYQNQKRVTDKKS